MENIIKNPHNSGDLVDKDHRGRFISGHKKIGGRKTGALNLSTQVRNALKKISVGNSISYEEALVKKILHKAIVEGDTRIIKLIWSYLDGSPPRTANLENMSDLANPISTDQKVILDAILASGS